MDLAMNLIYQAMLGDNSGGGGGGASFTKIHEEEVTVAERPTSSVVLTTINLPEDVIDPEKYVYFRITDKAGPRAGYFYSTEQFSSYYGNADTGYTTSPTFIRFTFYKNSSTRWAQTATQNGVYVDSLSKTGAATIKAYYSTSVKAEVIGTYKIEVYQLETPGGVIVPIT